MPTEAAHGAEGGDGTRSAAGTRQAEEQAQRWCRQLIYDQVCDSFQGASGILQFSCSIECELDSQDSPWQWFGRCKSTTTPKSASASASATNRTLQCFIVLPLGAFLNPPTTLGRERDAVGVRFFHVL